MEHKLGLICITTYVKIIIPSICVDQSRIKLIMWGMKRISKFYLFYRMKTNMKNRELMHLYIPINMNGRRYRGNKAKSKSYQILQVIYMISNQSKTKDR